MKCTCPWQLKRAKGVLFVDVLYTHPCHHLQCMLYIHSVIQRMASWSAVPPTQIMKAL